MLPVLILGVALYQTSSGLDDLDNQFKVANAAKPVDFSGLASVNQGVLTLLENNKLQLPADYLKASKLLSDWRMTFDFSRIKHELCLVALAGGDKTARTQVKKTWDMLNVSAGRGQRIGTIPISNYERYKTFAAPKSILDVLMDPDKAQAKALTAKSDDEVTKICADDQDARKGDFSKFTAKQMNDMSAGDKVRLKRIIELLEAGRVVTSEDFDHASLVLQHGEAWKDYCLAHELSICTLLLDSKKSPWLAAASYDRMLESGGFHQRFGTQYSSIGTNFVLGPVDTTGIGDAERKAMKCPTLEEAKNRKWD